MVKGKQFNYVLVFIIISFMLKGSLLLTAEGQE